MSRLTKRLENGVIKRVELDDCNRGDYVMSRLAALEDILYAPDGTERISLDRLRKIVAGADKLVPDCRECPGFTWFLTHQPHVEGECAVTISSTEESDEYKEEAHP